VSITFHGEAMGGRAVGKPRTGAMSSRDPVTAAKVAKGVVYDGKWRSLPGRDDRAKILMAIGNQARWALLALTADVVDVLPAVGKQGGCHWCAALIQRFPKPELERNPVNVALLGNGCPDYFQKRWREAELTAAAAREERAHLAAITAGGAPSTDAVRALARARRIVAGKTPEPSYYEPFRRPTGRY
jgi:hypothetical protein